jgi:hypothetical protein
MPFGVQRFKGSRVQGSGFRVQRFRGSEVQGFKGSRVQGSKVVSSSLCIIVVNLLYGKTDRFTFLQIRNMVFGNYIAKPASFTRTSGL